jgi:hypothetical protein
VVLHPLSRGETAPLERVFAGMSARSRRNRYLSGVPELTPGMLASLADVDQDQHGCWIAAVGSDPVGVGRYIRTGKDPEVAEIALEVVDRYQSHGLGRLLRDVVGVAAGDAGVTSLLWLMDESNMRIRHLAVPLRGRFRLERGIVEGRTELPTLPDLDAAQVVRCVRAVRSRPTTRSAA